MSTATGGSRATWTSSLAMCWSLIILGALGAAGWQLPAPQDKSQASRFQGWLQGHCGAFWDALFGHEHLEQRQEALVEGVLVVDPKDPPPPPLPHRDYPCRSGRRPNRRLEL
ncbi:hypothetical protein VFPFJ_04578 [Purpureocillium lilacinum]|uniref:Uncharacterized protein n=1 Tax=Purpureocillium lilacinum TaxID=33203 RepID=A0A179HL68_PURLI|nr:hypothetical protein VFPFJ_04578 [Purpureocillium lilacinum]OAQ90418.1 hypothetical protein VFPFJ_04578 [Purpureocillium lilacinum]